MSTGSKYNKCANCGEDRSRHSHDFSTFPANWHTFCPGAATKFEAPNIELHWAWDINLHQHYDPQPDDSNEVVCARAVLRVYCEKDGISDEMSISDIDFVNSLTDAVEAACEVLRERELL